MDTVYDIINDSEYRGVVREYILDELEHDSKTKLKIFVEWIIDYGDWDDTEYFAPLLREEVLASLDLEQMVDDLLDGYSFEEFGESFDIDWDGLGDMFGL